MKAKKLMVVKKVWLRTGLLMLCTVIFLFFLIASTNIVQGQTQPPPTTSGQPIVLCNPIGSTPNAPSCSGTGGISNIVDFLKKLIDIAIMLGIPVAVLFIIYSGFLFVTAQGNPAKLAAARKALLAAIIGTAILLAAWVIATAIKGTIDALRP